MPLRIPIYDDFKDAKSITKKAESDYNNAQNEVKQSREKTKKALEVYGKTKVEIYDQSIRTFVKEFQRIKGVDLSAIQASDSIAHNTLKVIDIQNVDFKTIDGVKTAIAGGGAGAISGAVSFGAVGAFATASTGTAISTLSGAAATNATLAWLGGGSIAAGGGGVAAGTAIFGGLVAIPVLAVAGLIFNSKAKEALENAKANRAQVNEFIAEKDAAVAAMTLISDRSGQLQEVLLQINEYLVSMTDKLRIISNNSLKKTIVNKILRSIKKWLLLLISKFNSSINVSLVDSSQVNYSSFSHKEQEHLWLTTTLAQTIKNIMDTDLLDDYGKVTNKSKKVLSVGRKLLPELSSTVTTIDNLSNKSLVSSQSKKDENIVKEKKIQYAEYYSAKGKFTHRFDDYSSLKKHFSAAKSIAYHKNYYKFYPSNEDVPIGLLDSLDDLNNKWNND